jgi:hypothetical protein
VPNPKQDREEARRWFANHTGGGTSLVTRMVGMYSVLCDADPSAEPESTARKSTSDNKSQKKKTAVKPSTTSPKTTNGQPESAKQKFNAPDVNINLQIHISSDVTPDQIDKIFESMARHIYKSE